MLLVSYSNKAVSILQLPYSECYLPIFNYPISILRKPSLITYTGRSSVKAGGKHAQSSCSLEICTIFTESIFSTYYNNRFVQSINIYYTYMFMVQSIQSRINSALLDSWNNNNLAASFCYGQGLLLTCDEILITNQFRLIEKNYRQNQC